jgi:hypothetical protein
MTTFRRQPKKKEEKEGEKEKEKEEKKKKKKAPHTTNPVSRTNATGRTPFLPSSFHYCSFTAVIDRFNISIRRHRAVTWRQA